MTGKTPESPAIAANEGDTNYTDCPNCGVVWSAEEIKYQACDHCGYPLHQEQKQTFELDFSNTEYLH
jgi:ribosomal protein S27AE